MINAPLIYGPYLSSAWIAWTACVDMYDADHP